MHLSICLSGYPIFSEEILDSNKTKRCILEDIKQTRTTEALSDSGIMEIIVTFGPFSLSQC